MRYLTYVFPGAAVIFLLLVFSEYVPLLREKNAFPPGPEYRRWTRRDSLWLGLLTAVYAFVAFLGLGDTVGIESFYSFESGPVLVELPEEMPLGRLRYYSGLYMGEYELDLSADGVNFIPAATLKQGHADVFKWNEAELAPERESARFLRISTKKSQLRLGELALYDGEGALIPAEKLSYDPGCGALFDEQEKIPERYDYHNSTYFDEIYHARTAYEHILNLYPYEITHPPLGKLILGIGIRAFGMVPFGWRFSGTLIGVLMLPALYVLLKKMFGGTAVPVCGTAVFAFDFMHYVQTRLATIDSYAVFFTLLMYLFFWLYWQSDRASRKSWLPPLALSGLCFGLGAASKWTCIYSGGGLAVLWLLDRIFRGLEQRREGEPGKAVREAAGNILWCLLLFVAVPAAVYYVSYWPYGAAKGLSGFGMLFSKEYLRIVADNQKYMFNYHSGVTATHPYSSVWWQWILDVRPILYYLQYPAEGIHVSFGAWVNPMLCWGGLLAMVCMLWRVFRWGDRTALFILVGYLAQLLPWVFVTRVVFEYHYFPSTVFLLLALGHVFRSMEHGRPGWRRPVYGFTAVALGLFVLFYPALRGLPVTSEFGRSFLKWLPTWPF